MGSQTCTSHWGRWKKGELTTELKKKSGVSIVSATPHRPWLRQEADPFSTGPRKQHVGLGTSRTIWSCSATFSVALTEVARRLPFFSQNPRSLQQVWSRVGVSLPSLDQRKVGPPTPLWGPFSPQWSLNRHLLSRTDPNTPSKSNWIWLVQQIPLGTSEKM